MTVAQIAPIRSAARLALFAALAGAGAPCWAVLGGDVASVQADQSRMRATRQAVDAAQAGSMHEIGLPDGGSIRQFVNAQGIVYAVAWSTRLKPDFVQLLGQHAADFAVGAASAAQAPGLKRRAVVDRGDLVVVSTGRPGAFVGKAWLKSQLPSGVRSDAIR